ncbi:MAG: hypothetical protein F9K45_01040 [Melioribacteraceae bacterium]|nr:MAG: hypothetical protein F9K45_01040 [Melioribacteraceae bacterium]
MIDKKSRKYILTCSGIPFSGYTQNGAQVIFGGTAVEFINASRAVAIRSKLGAVIKSKDDVIGLYDTEFPLEILIEVREK